MSINNNNCCHLRYLLITMDCPSEEIGGLYPLSGHTTNDKIGNYNGLSQCRSWMGYFPCHVILDYKIGHYNGLPYCRSRWFFF